MKNMTKYIGLCLIILLGATSCSKEDLVVDSTIGGPQYVLPKGEPGSLDERIYNIHQKYGTYILYEFEATDLKYLWTGSWSKWYTPAVTSENKKYISRFLDKIEEVILSKFEVDFVKRTLPYKIFLVEMLSKNSEKPTSSSGYVLMQSNGQNAFVISNVGPKSDTWGAKDWTKFDTELNALYTQNYYDALPTKPSAFLASKFGKTLVPQIKDPSGEDDDYFFSMRSVGYISGKMGTTSLSPTDSEDYTCFVSFLTATPAKEIKRVFQKYPAMKTRAVLLVPYLYDVVGINVVLTQNGNCPDDKLEKDYFDKLQ